MPTVLPKEKTSLISLIPCHPFLLPGVIKLNHNSIVKCHKQIIHLVLHDNLIMPQFLCHFQVHSDGYISLQTTGSSPASKESDPVISVYLSDVDTSGIGQIYYGYNIMYYYALQNMDIKN